MIAAYIRCYNAKRVQRGLGTLTPLEKYSIFLAT